MKKENFNIFKSLSLILLFLIFSTLSFSFFSFNLNQQSLNDIEGVYLGTLSVGSSDLRLALVISKNLFIKDKLDAILISIDQGGSMIPASLVKYEDSNLIVSFDSIKAKITILNKNEDKLKTIFQQGSFKTELSFSKIPRPQHPIPPYEYEEKEVTLTNAKINLNGTLTVPSNKSLSKEGKFPAIILITGSGAQNRDEEIFGHKPFLVISDFLTKLGFVTLRVDDRGVGIDSKIISNSDTFDFISDAICQINYLKSLDFIDISKIGVLGHSEGGLISFILASEYSQDISFIISLAGPALRGDILLLLQQEAIARASGVKEKDIKKMIEINSALYGAVIKYKDEQSNENLINEIKNIAKKYKLSKEDAERVIAELTSKWFKTFIALDPSYYIKKIKCPALLLFGEKDLQVPAKQNLEAINSILSQTNQTNLKIIVAPSANHLFQKASTGNIFEYALIKETISDDTLNFIKDFLISLF